MSYIRELEGLRGFMALWVVIGHWATTADLPRAISETKLYNGSAVNVFIILSGFAIASLISKRQQEGYTRYLIRRFLRIFPVYLFFLTISVLMAEYALEAWLSAPQSGYMNERRAEIAQNSLTYFWPHLAAHLPALHGVVPPSLLPDSDYAFLGQAWSISLEWQFYLLAPLLVGCVMHPTRVTLGVAAVCIGILLWLGRFSTLQMPSGFLGSNFHLIGFYIGICSAVVLGGDLIGKRIEAGQAQMTLAALFVVTVVLTALKAEFVAMAIWVGVMWMIIGLRRPEARSAQFLSSVLLAPISQHLGKMSYSLYLSHMLVIIIGLRILGAAGMTEGWGSAAILLIITLIGTYLLSLLSYNYIEKPFQDYGRRFRAHRVNEPAPSVAS